MYNQVDCTYTIDSAVVALHFRSCSHLVGSERMSHQKEPDSASLEDDRQRVEGDQPKKRPRRPRRGHYKPLYVPIRDAFEMIGVGPTKGYELLNAGVIKTVRIGRRVDPETGNVISRGRLYATFESLELLATPDDDSSEAA
jgi:hypothetical protein